MNGIEESKERTTELFLVADHTALEKPGAAVTVRRKKFPDRIFGPNKNRINSLVDLEGTIMIRDQNVLNIQAETICYLKDRLVTH